MLFLYGDIIFEAAVLEKLLKSSADISLVVDLAWYDQQQHGQSAPHIKPDLVSLQDPPGQSYLFRYITPDEQNRILKIGQHIPHEQAHGEFIGLAMFSERGIEAFKAGVSRGAREVSEYRFSSKPAASTKRPSPI